MASYSQPLRTRVVMVERGNTHFTVVGYVLWIFGFFGLHRFYYGKPITGAIWALTGGLCLVGWIVDLFLIPAMDAQAQGRYRTGPLDYTVAWLLQTFLGYLGVHRFYMGKWISGIIWLLTGGLFGVGWLYDFFTLNEQLTVCNTRGA
jgi:TM2 domain-containing membrane protein YozV